MEVGIFRAESNFRGGWSSGRQYLAGDWLFVLCWPDAGLSLLICKSMVLGMIIAETGMIIGKTGMIFAGTGMIISKSGMIIRNSGTISSQVG
ncbi:hypothetical protein [Bacillus sp. AG4(2022)]|uniref:hypothetical protein n=1 Tax=Bacillus sp. AG4(2022) TaxID=2962594 RepID=UPI002880F3FA|nr:hypothetical protein [Bacillus sp. AG4(2022)]MDT0161547.1 hypothetical protein [Bacillus sp. AG4(2022)]